MLLARKPYCSFLQAHQTDQPICGWFMRLAWSGNQCGFLVIERQCALNMELILTISDATSNFARDDTNKNSTIYLWQLTCNLWIISFSSTQLYKLIDKTTSHTSHTSLFLRTNCCIWFSFWVLSFFISFGSCYNSMQTKFPLFGCKSLLN